MNLEIKNGNFGYLKDNLILKDINLKINDGEIFTILGQNGIGKTTLLKCLNGVLKWSSGEMYIGGKRVNSPKELKSIGYVPQAHNLSFPYSVRELTIMGRARYLGMFSTPSEKDQKLVEEVLDEIGILHLIDKKCSELSGGQLQMVFVARALVGTPEILILDEPESHLDFKNQAVILKLIVKLVRERGITCIFNTHYPEYALRISDRSMIMGKNDYITGKSSDIINENNLKKYFGIETKILDTKIEDKILKSVIITDDFNK
ncbi:ABC transporter ATP-binding protein [Fusobacterium varium]|uniref:ABC transporter ATP-binding protein n=1 Tax=Fusobacterium TaxID=848 RepID=UPI0030CE6D69